MAAEELLYFNGINGDSGEYGVRPVTADQLQTVIAGQSPPSSETLGELNLKKQEPFPTKQGVDATKLDQAGWALVLPQEPGPHGFSANQIKEALHELIEWRKRQAGPYFRIYEGGDGYRAGETKSDFCNRQNVGGGPADPEQMPYYTLLVGSPEEIPYAFQYQLDVMRGVGRLHFDQLEDYAAYAQAVVQAETGAIRLPRRAAFFGAANEDDKATQLSSQHLVHPLFEKINTAQANGKIVRWIEEGDTSRKLQMDWECQAILSDHATKPRLLELLGGDQTPAFLFTASHGMEFAKDSPRQIPHQGALLCQDWPGPKQHRGNIPQDWYLAGDDLTASTNLAGLVAFFFACYGAGTPQLDQYAEQAFKDKRAVIAAHDFTANLPLQMLKRGSLAVVGHVERAWGYSFLNLSGNAQLGTFFDAVKQLLAGDPVGLTMESFNLRYSDLATSLSHDLGELKHKRDYIDAYQLAQKWTENNDARSYILLGDPAVRVPFARPGDQPAGERRITLSAETTARFASALAKATDAAPVKSSTAEIDSARQPPAAQQAAAFDMASFSVQVQEERASLTDSIKKFTGELAESLKKAADDISSLEVVTYTSDDLKAVQDQKFAEGAGSMKRRALTRIAFDGDVQVCVPEKDGKVDEDLWNIHLSMVKAAQENRAAFLQTMAELATKLIGMLGGK
jgi:hypothetical protein